MIEERVRSTRHRKLTLLDAVTDPHIFQPWFKDPTSWAAWFAFLAALFALPMSADQLVVYRQCTGRNAPPTEAAKEGWLVIGRRGGKSFIMALVAVWLACFRDYRPYLAPGERATIMLIAADRKQAKLVLRYIAALLTRVSMLRPLIERETADVFELVNSVDIVVATASLRTVRGYTLAAIIADEIAFWSVDDDSADPDREIITALRPGLVTIPGAILLAASSPYSRRGELWNAHRKHFGKDGEQVLIWQAATKVMNPSVPQSVIDEAYERDPASAAAEFGAQFRTDVEAFVTREVVEACITPDVRERPRIAGVTYAGFVDPSGGSSDSMTLAIGHREDKTIILDALRERHPPFSPDDVVAEFADLLKSYGLSKVVGDRYAGEWPRERFAVHRIKYEPAARPKSDLYRDLLPLLNSRQVELLDVDRLAAQLVGLERRVGRSGRDSIDHGPRGHDDVANVLAGVAAMLGKKPGSYVADLSWVTDDPDASAAYLDRMLGRMH